MGRVYYIPIVSYTLRLNKIIVGHSELEHRDAGMGIAGGRFRPGLGYELVQPVFRLFSEAAPRDHGQPVDDAKLARYHAARDKLALELVDAGGRPVRTTSIHIVDSTVESGPDAIEIEVMLADPSFFAASPPPT
jgi:hypothetical protein